ncbi:MAG: 6-phosphogluconolactonase [Pyrinomonadaceae bacterium]|nr:6-phosphogluconolactonase [Pyrinomonadaceae bacterium]
MKIPKNVNIFPDIDALSAAAANEFVRLSAEFIKQNGRFTVVLSGGSTPVKLFKLLASEDYRSKVDWENVCFFFVDERDVSPASDQSNFKLASENLFKPLGIDRTQIIRWQTEIIDAAGVAAQFETTVRKFLKLPADEFPVFDLIFLGLGADGHTASLFPHSKALTNTTNIGVANLVDKYRAFRLTMTFPVINRAKNVIFMVNGEEKAEILSKVFHGEKDIDKYPAQGVSPKNGDLKWFVDEAAAALLK